jgi:hypothetical protein
MSDQFKEDDNVWMVDLSYEMHRGGKTRKRSYRKKQTIRR